MDDIKETLTEVFKDVKDVLSQQQKEIEELRSLLNSKEEQEEEKNDFDILRDDIKSMLQGFNRQNPITDTNSDNFDKKQMDILGGR